MARRTFALALLAWAAACGAARAGDAPPTTPLPPAPGGPASATPGADLKPLTDAEAAPLLDGLKKALRARTAADALPALDALRGVAHPGFEPILGKLLAHPQEDVAARAARAMGDRPSNKTAGALWRAWILPVNDRRFDVKIAILDALARMRAPLDAKQYDEVEKLWKQAPNPEAMNAVTAYFAAVRTDKRPCKMLAMWLDEPRAGSVGDASNPPTSYWEARWKLWQATKGGAAQALQAITGQAFASSDAARTWFKANPKFGVNW